MLFFLSKVLLFLIKPLFWCCLLLLLVVMAKHAHRRKRLCLVALVLLLFFSNNYIAGKIANTYEASYPKQIQKYDVGVVLGGFSGLNERNHQIKLNSSGDRLFQAISLYKKGIISKLLITGGNGNITGPNAKEADLAVAYLKMIGIPDSAIILENQSRNTIENAKYSLLKIRALKQNPKILLITSAWHIPRAKLIFSKNNRFQTDYYPTDFKGKTHYDPEDYFIPDPIALDTWNALLKEWVGLLVDRFRI